MKIRTIRSNFHKTKMRIKVPSDHSGCVLGYIETLECRAAEGDKDAKKTLKRIWNTLCGIEGCQCGITEELVSDSAH